MSFASLVSLAILTTAIATTEAQQIHPGKREFSDLPTWSTISPSNTTRLKNFTPFRAVYDRTYKQGKGQNAGATRKDRVIISAESVGWEGTSAVAVNVIDSGIVEHADTNARVSSSIIGQSNLRVLFEISPIPGSAKDYYIARVDPNAILFSQISTDEQVLRPRTMKTSQPGFGPTLWAIASMGLKKGKKIKLGPTLSSGSPLSAITYGRVNRSDTFEDSSGRKYRSWVIESTGNASSPNVSHVHVTDKPPYYLGKETINLDTGKRERGIWLQTSQSFEQ